MPRETERAADRVFCALYLISVRPTGTFTAYVIDGDTFRNKWVAKAFETKKSWVVLLQLTLSAPEYSSRTQVADIIPN